MGYAGGPQKHPTYHDIGDHAEAIQLDFDPRHIAYGDLLDLFWAARTPTRPAWKRQYMSALFFLDDEQRRQALDSKRRIEEGLGREVFVEILPADTFHRAEDYHQKYYLQHQADLMAELRPRFGSFQDFVDSTAVARVNGFLGGARAQAAANRDLSHLGLSDRAAGILAKSGR